MEEESSEAEKLQEWASMAYITRQIKPGIRTGFSLVKQSLSCVDFTDTHVALGSNCGVVYWCPRSGHKPRELRIQELGIPITTIRLGVRSKDFDWIATGDKLGSIHVFQISTKHSFEDRMYQIPKHHKAAVTALEWNDTGEILFSGDEIGNVKTCELLFNKTSLVGNKKTIDEQYKIIQLSFKSPDFLLISTLHRAVIVKDVTCKDSSINRIGKKARISLIPLGGVFAGSESEPVVFTARPRQKIWIADINGEVLKTLIFTNLISEPCPKISLINSAINLSNTNDLSNVEFSRIEELPNKYLVVSHHHGVLILNTETVSVVASLSGLQDLKNVAVHSNEIMFLEGNSNLVRLGWEPDPYQPRLSENIKDHKLPVGEALSDISTRLRDGALRFVPILTATFQGALKSPDQVSEADEASELPPIVSVDGIAPLYVDRSSPTVRCVQSHEFENIALAQKRIRRKKSVKKSQSIKMSSGVDSGSDSISTTSAFSELTSDSELSRHPSLTNMVLEDSTSIVYVDIHSSRDVYVPVDIKPDLRSLEVINADVSSKEKILEETLHLNDVISSFMNKDSSFNGDVKNGNNENYVHSAELEEALAELNDYCDPVTAHSLNSIVNNEAIPSCDQAAHGNSSPVSGNIQLEEEAQLMLFNGSSENSNSTFDGLLYWDSMKVPECLKWFSVSDKFILIGGKKMNVYLVDRREKTCSWKKLEYKASQMFISPKASLVWKLDISVVHQLNSSDLFSNDWQTVSRNVTSVSLNDFMAWYICDNRLYMQSAINSSSNASPAAHVPSQLQLTIVSCYKLFVWVLSEGNQVQRREGVTEDCLTGNVWVNIITPDRIQVKNIIAGPNFSGWIVSSYNDLYFTKDCSENVPNWFQLLLADPIHLLRDPLVHLIDSTLWIADSDSQFLYHNNSVLEGEEWIQLCEGKWKLISAGGIFVDYGSLWLCSDRGRLYQTYPHSCTVMQEISPPNDLEIVCLAALSEVLWLLLTNGEIYIRQGISANCFAGKSWKPLDMQQISKKVIFQYLSIGLDSVWAVSKLGEVFVAVGSPFSMSTAVFAPAWVQVESEIVMAKVFVGPELHMVWAIDTHKNVYVRDAIFPDFQIGLSWVLVPGIKATHLSMSSSGVWAISSNREVFRRHGITQNNYIGDYWRKHTNSLSFISVSGDDNVWGLDRKNFLVVRKAEFFSVSDDIEPTKTDNPVEDLWEIIDRKNSTCSYNE